MALKFHHENITSVQLVDGIHLKKCAPVNNMKILACKRVPQKVTKPVRLRRNLTDILYVSSAIIGFIVTYDAYFGSGLTKDQEMQQEIRIMQELNKNDKEMLEIVKRLDAKIAYNSRAILELKSHFN